MPIPICARPVFNRATASNIDYMGDRWTVMIATSEGRIVRVIRGSRVAAIVGGWVAFTILAGAVAALSFRPANVLASATRDSSKRLRAAKLNATRSAAANDHERRFHARITARIAEKIRIMSRQWGSNTGRALGRNVVSASHGAGIPARDAMGHRRSFHGEFLEEVMEIGNGFPFEQPDTLRLVRARNGETIEVKPFDDAGKPKQKAFRKISHLMRSWQSGDEASIDPRLVRLLLLLSQRVKGRDVFIVSGFRLPGQRNTRETSYHTRGMAADIRVRGMSTTDLFALMASLDASGIGLYPHDGFVHADVRPTPERWYQMKSGKYVMMPIEWRTRKRLMNCRRSLIGCPLGSNGVNPNTRNSKRSVKYAESFPADSRSSKPLRALP